MQPASTSMRFQNSQIPETEAEQRPAGPGGEQGAVAGQASRARGTAGSRGRSGQQGPGDSGKPWPVSGDRAFGDHEQGLPAAVAGPSSAKAFNTTTVRLHMDKSANVLLNVEDGAVMQGVVRRREWDESHQQPLLWEIFWGLHLL